MSLRPLFFLDFGDLIPYHQPPILSLFFEMPSASPNYPAPLQSTGSLAKLGKTDLTPSIGTEFHPSVKIVDLLDTEAHPTAIRDLAIIVCVT